MLTAEQQSEAKIRLAIEKEGAALARLLVSRRYNDLFGKTAFEPREPVLKIGAKAYEGRLREKNGYEGSGVDCPACQQTAAFQGYRPLRPLSILGPLALRRAYYYRRRCGGVVPWDKHVGLTAKRLTPAAEGLVSLVGTTGESFEGAAAQLLPKLSSLRLPESAVRRTSEAAGTRVKNRGSNPPPRP